MIKTIGFPISRKENESRRTILPIDMDRILHPENLYFESGYGRVLGISDSEYEKCGCHIVSAQEVLRKDIICDPKVGDASYLSELTEGQIVFGWLHATQNRDITDTLIQRKLTAYAWEKMYYKGRHVFWRNNELAGEAAVCNAFQCYAKMPYETKVAVIGGGNTARGALKALYKLGADVVQYNRKMEDLLREELSDYDVVVNCVLWDVTRKDHIIYREDLKRMKPGSMIVDVSCDRNGGIETSVPTSIEEPTYEVDGVVHYVVDHTPSIFHKTFTSQVSKIIAPYCNQLITGELSSTLQDSLIMEKGKIIDQEIVLFQKR